MQVDKDDDTNPRSSVSDPGDTGSTLLISGKLRDKLQKLSKWRINPSSIKFPEDAREFRGGYGTVSRAFLVSTSSSKWSEDNSKDTEDKDESDGGTPRRKAVAVKKMKIENERTKSECWGEAGFLAELSNENVIELEGFVEDLSQDKIWLVFTWAANGNLKEFVASTDWEIPERIWLINDVARGAEYLHSRDPPIYHGDLKSANVLVNSGHRAIITDFGSARHLPQNAPPVQPKRSENGVQPALLLETEFCETTNTVTLTGNQYTLRWAAPELLMDDEPGLWSDIWALGWIFYEVMTNAIPFENVQKDSVVVIHVIQGDLPSVADHARMVLIRALYSLMTTCWNIDPSKRPTAEDCQKSIRWMPKVIPDRQRAANTSVSGARSAELLIEMADMHIVQDDHINASKLLTEALAICTDTANNAGKAEALFLLAEVNRCQDNYSEAVGLYREAVQMYTDIGNRKGRAQALFGLADLDRIQNKDSEAVTFYSEVIEICTETGNERLKANTLWGLAEVHRAQEEYSKAVTFYSESVQICIQIGDRRGRADALVGLADVHRFQNEHSEAIPLYSEAIQLHTSIGNRGEKAYALRALADVHRLQEQYSQAVQPLSEALQICTDIGDRYGRAWALVYLADVHRDQDQHDDAIRLYEEAAGVFEEIGDTQDAEGALSSAAEARQQLEPEEAE